MKIRSRSLVMKEKPIKLPGNRKTGFLLSEAMLALFVTALTILVLQQSINLSQKVMNLESYSNIRTHIVQMRLSEFLDKKTIGFWPIPKPEKSDKTKKYKQIRIYGIYKDDREQVVFIRASTNFLYQSINDGFEPIMANVKEFEAKKVNEDLLLKITLNNGKETEMFFSNVEWKT